MRFQSYFNTAVVLIRSYNGSVPLVHFLKQYFAQHKKHGSKDRKLITHLCYNYFRLGHALQDISAEERLRVAIFLCNDLAGDWAILFDKNWMDNWTSALTARIDFVGDIYPAFSTASVFPWRDELSDGIDGNAFAISHLIQPDLFLRIRPGKEKIVLQKLDAQLIGYRQTAADCLALPNATKTDDIIKTDEEAVVQDYSSQRIQEFLRLVKADPGMPVPVWDCCAASGGKSLLAFDVFKNISLTVSDLRPAILRNLRERFSKAGIQKYQSFTADLSSTSFTVQHSPFNLIICDAPCSGSGTWGRTPEQLYFFTKDKINGYTALQKKIVQNVMQHLAPGGYLLYITCSVFRKENEDVVAMIEKEYPLQLVKQELLKGYTLKADSMFAALFCNKRS